MVFFSLFLLVFCFLIYWAILCPLTGGFTPFRIKVITDKYMKVKVTQSCLTLCDPMDYTVHGILQARILEWVTIPFSRGSSQPRYRTQVSHIAGGFITSWVTREAHWSIQLLPFCYSFSVFFFKGLFTSSLYICVCIALHIYVCVYIQYKYVSIFILIAVQVQTFSKFWIFTPFPTSFFVLVSYFTCLFTSLNWLF